MMTADEVRQARETLGMSRAEMARALGIHKNTLGYAERNGTRKQLMVLAIQQLITSHTMAQFYEEELLA